jgi:hypothetical protein
MTQEQTVRTKSPAILREAKVGKFTVIMYQSRDIAGYVNVSRFGPRGSIKNDMCLGSVAGAECVFNDWTLSEIL